MTELEIPYKIINITCEPIDELHLPSFKGSSFRGVIGRTLRQALCVLKSYKDCHQCPIYKNCYYAYIFETIPDPHKKLPFNLHKYPSIPHPFVIEPPLDNQNIYKSGETFLLKIVLIGKAVSYEPYFILAVELAGEHGIGKENRKFIIKDISSTDILRLSVNFPLTKDVLHDQKSSNVLINIHTPLRLIHNKKLVRKLEFHHIVRSLLRRITVLYYYHVSEKLPEIPAKALIELAEKVKVVDNNLKWYDWERFSYRQEKRMKLGGLIGKISFEGPIEPFFPLLKAGEILHCGKNTSFGLGKYKIVEV